MIASRAEPQTPRMGHVKKICLRVAAVVPGDGPRKVAVRADHRDDAARRARAERQRTAVVLEQRRRLRRAGARDRDRRLGADICRRDRLLATTRRAEAIFLSLGEHVRAFIAPRHLRLK